MQSFTQPIICQISNDGKSYVLYEAFFYVPKEHKERLQEGYNSQYCILVPQGFVSDGFTNGGLNFVVQKFGKGLKCAILHDYLCNMAKEGKNTRKYADTMFLEAMLETKAFFKIKAYFLWACVRIYAVCSGKK